MAIAVDGTGDPCAQPDAAYRQTRHIDRHATSRMNDSMRAEFKKRRCPLCGFTVFNPRYPKCEKCGEQLPEDLVLSREELAEVQEKERLERQSRAGGHDGSNPTDIDIVLNIISDFTDGHFG